MRLNLLFLFVFLVAFKTQAQKDWKVFTSPEGAFSVEFPGTPQINTIQRQSEEGIRVTLHMHIVSVENTVAYVLYNDFEVGVNVLEEKIYLDDVTTEIIKRVNQDTSLIESVEFDGYPGRRFAKSAKDGMAEVRVILRNNRAY